MNVILKITLQNVRQIILYMCYQTTGYHQKATLILVLKDIVPDVIPLKAPASNAIACIYGKHLVMTHEIKPPDCAANVVKDYQ